MYQKIILNVEGVMIEVKLLPGNAASPIRSASFAALTCYMARFPIWDRVIKWFQKLFKTGHHTTFMHAASYFSFMIEGISVGDITFGLHLTSPFYNSSQRSGRYCSSMFVRFVRTIRMSLQKYLSKIFPGYIPKEEKQTVLEINPGQKLLEIRSYIRHYWPEIGDDKLGEIMSYVNHGIEIFQSNIEAATIKAAELAKKERPHASAGSIADNAPKFAQEQLRNFIPVIVPTGMVYTVNLISLVALYESAWTPAMRDVTQKMVDAVLKKFPKLSPMFNKENRRKEDWGLSFEEGAHRRLSRAPRLDLLNVNGEKDFILPFASHRHPVDKLHYDPQLMDNGVGDIETRVTLSVATMGQDQRHRTIHRGTPKFTGEFYLAPILDELGLESEAGQIISQWLIVSESIPDSLRMVLAPYGAMTTYKKRGSFLAVDHEQGKRLCWCAQQEIYWLGVLLRDAIIKKFGITSPLLKIFEPPCYQTGKCSEGDRCCGREMKKGRDYFPFRGV